MPAVRKAVIPAAGLGTRMLPISRCVPKEMFPMCGMDENTVCYLMADLARRLFKYEDAGRWVARVLASRSANERIKAKARELKEHIAEEMKKEG